MRVCLGCAAAAAAAAAPQIRRPRTRDAKQEFEWEKLCAPAHMAAVAALKLDFTRVMTVVVVGARMHGTRHQIAKVFPGGWAERWWWPSGRSGCAYARHDISRHLI